VTFTFHCEGIEVPASEIDWLQWRTPRGKLEPIVGPLTVKPGETMIEALEELCKARGPGWNIVTRGWVEAIDAPANGLAFQPGDRVKFRGSDYVGQHTHTIKSVGRRSLADGFEPFVELEDLPGEFAPHLFLKVEP
jgi:hypothetical protein